MREKIEAVAEAKHLFGLFINLYPCFSSSSIDVGDETVWQKSGVARFESGAIADDHGRIMVLMTHNTDINDSWEREGEDPEFFERFSPAGYELGVNAILYALTH